MGEELGYIGLTDPDWYSFLSTQPRVDEANFWQPHGDRNFRAIRPGQPFFFKLRAPHKAIVGFGFFARFEALPVWLAWECFGEMNGAPDFESMVERISRLRGDAVSATGDFRIGCVMVAAPVFFEPDEWVSPPTDWARTGIQQGKTYRLHLGEGERVWRECLERATKSRYWNVEPEEEPAALISPRYGAPTRVRPRLGQGLFTLAVRDAYQGACAVTGEHSGPVLEAAHIVPYGRGGEHRIDNGLLLRSDLHRLFDRGYVTVTPDYVFRVGDRLREDFNNGHSYYGLTEQRILLPEAARLRPKSEYLEWHGVEVFRG
jgi:putative restriction endonuclease